MTSTTYLTVPEAADYLRFPTPHAFRAWARRHGLPSCRRGGRTLLFLRRDLDEAVGNRRHATQSRTAASLDPVTTCALTEAR